MKTYMHREMSQLKVLRQDQNHTTNQDVPVSISFLSGLGLYDQQSSHLCLETYTTVDSVSRK